MDGKHGYPRPPSLADIIADDLVAALRTKGSNNRAMKERLTARMMLLDRGWTVDQVNEAQRGKDEPIH